MKLDELPADVLCYITEYFEIGDDLNKLINSHKFFRNISQIREKYLISLKNEKAKLYYDMGYDIIPQNDWFRKLNQHKLSLNLTGCPNITDVSALGNVHTLKLSLCQNITDVSALGNVHTLDLVGCNNITDVSALRNVNTLYLHGCPQITDTSMLKNTRILR